MINGLNALESRPEELADRQRSCLLGKKKRLEDSTGRYSMLGGSNQVNGVGNPDKRPKVLNPQVSLRVFLRPRVVDQLQLIRVQKKLPSLQISLDLSRFALTTLQVRLKEERNHLTLSLMALKLRKADLRNRLAITQVAYRVRKTD